jgi:hypothetical protein
MEYGVPPRRSHKSRICSKIYLPMLKSKLRVSKRTNTLPWMCKALAKNMNWYIDEFLRIACTEKFLCPILTKINNLLVHTFHVQIIADASYLMISITDLSRNLFVLSLSYIFMLVWPKVQGFECSVNNELRQWMLYQYHFGRVGRQYVSPCILQASYNFFVL